MAVAVDGLVARRRTVAAVGGLKTDRRTAAGSAVQEAAAAVEGPARAMANS